MTRHLHRDSGFVEATRLEDGTVLLRVSSGDHSAVAILDAGTAAAVALDLIDAAIVDPTE